MSANGDRLLELLAEHSTWYANDIGDVMAESSSELIASVSLDFEESDRAILAALMAAAPAMFAALRLALFALEAAPQADVQAKSALKNVETVLAAAVRS